MNGNFSLIDTHTHFDIVEFDKTRLQMAKKAALVGVKHIVLIGLLAQFFQNMKKVAQDINLDAHLQAHVAFGLHPLYIEQQTESDLILLESFIQDDLNIAVAEIGLDTYPKRLQEEYIFCKQKQFFIEQIQLAKTYHRPIILHIRKAHAEVLKILQQQNYHAKELGGIAHSFSGGEQEALSFVKRGFKLGITGQITNPNAKKLHRAVLSVYKKYGLQAFVIETDCPDMTPIFCRENSQLNEPANLPYVLDGLAKVLMVPSEKLAEQLWKNSCEALHVDWRE